MAQMMKIYRRHRCERRHHSYAAMAKCIWKKAAWVKGDGKYASVSYCTKNRSGWMWAEATVMLFTSLGEAETAKDWIDHGGCGGACTRRHELIELER